MNDCPHEDNILYGKAVKINKLNRVIQVMCDSCRAYGTIYEKREKHSSNLDWYEVAEQWHKMTDYYPRHVVERLKSSRPHGFIPDITKKYMTSKGLDWFYAVDGHSKAYSYDGQFFFKDKIHG